MRNTKQQLLDCERCCRIIIVHHVKIHPADQDTYRHSKKRCSSVSASARQ
jgi:hypothetical protein